MGEGVTPLGQGMHGTKADPMFLGSNQKVKVPSGRVDASMAVNFSLLFSCPRLSCSQGTKSWESQVISSLGTSSSLRLHLHVRLIPHLSAAKTCPAFDGKHLNLFGTSRPRLWPSGPTTAEQHQSCGQITFLHHKMNRYRLAGGPTSLRVHLALWWCHK